MTDSRVSIGEYVDAIRAVVPLAAQDLPHATRLYQENVPLWLVLSGILIPEVPFRDLANTLIVGTKATQGGNACVPST